jgi:hypothetical protein
MGHIAAHRTKVISAFVKVACCDQRSPIVCFQMFRHMGFAHVLRISEDAAICFVAGAWLDISAY